MLRDCCDGLDESVDEEDAGLGVDCDAVVDGVEVPVRAGVDCPELAGFLAIAVGGCRGGKIGGGEVWYGGSSMGWCEYGRWQLLKLEVEVDPAYSGHLFGQS